MNGDARAVGSSQPPRVAGPWRATPPALVCGAALLLLPLAFDLQLSAVWRTGLHVVLELAMATIAFAVFLLTWNTRGWRPATNLVGTGVAMLGVALLSAAHLLSGPGMPGMAAAGACAVSGTFAFGAQGWMAAGVLFAALSPWRSPRYERLFSSALTATALWTAGMALLAGMSLAHELCESPLRQSSEQLLVIAFTAAALLLARRNSGSDPAVVSTMAWAALLMACSAAVFVLQARSQHMAVILAHVYKLAGGFLVYRALFRDGVDWPYRRIAESERIAEDRRRHYQQLFDSAPDGVLLVDGAGSITSVNPAAAAMFGWPLGELVGAQVERLMPARLRELHLAARSAYAAAPRAREMAGGRALAGRRRDGSEFPIEVALVPQQVDGLPATLCVVRDVSRRQMLEQRLVQQASQDALTRLPNRRVFQMRLARALDSHRERQLAVMFIDLDDFQQINDTLGHHRGDALLREVASRLRGALRDADTLARLGGDEFAVLLEGIEGDQDVASIARRLLDVFDVAVHHDKHEMLTGASIGIALHPSDGTTAEELQRHAELAMYRAKSEGGGRWCLFEPEMDRSVLERVALQQDLRGALGRGELLLHYQPRVRAADGTLSGFEALLRWQHPERGNVPPDRFIALAEGNGSIVAIGAWVLRETCAQARRWIDAGMAPVTMAVNVSPHQLRDGDFAERLEQILQETGWPPHRLELELTESTLMEAQSVALLARLAGLGVRLAVDDFGTGYSSLAYLKRFRLHRLKVDKTFVKQLGSDTDDRVIVSTIIVLGHALGLQVTAEGVETAAQAAFLVEQGCDELQGFHFGRPMPAPECEHLMRGQFISPLVLERQLPLLHGETA